MSTILPELNIPEFRRGAWPVVGHLPRMMKDMLGYFREGQTSHGDFYWSNSGFGNWSLVCVHPEVFDAFKNRTTTSAHLRERGGALLGDSVLTNDGAPHRHMRGAINPPFTPKGLTASVVGPLMADALGKRISSWKRDQSFEILRETREVTLDIIFQMMGVPLTELHEWSVQFSDFLLTAFPIPWEFPGTPRWKGMKAKAWLDDHFRPLIAELRQNPAPGQLLSDLVHAQDEDGVPLSETELLDNLRILALAGHDTTATTMAWMTISLARNPDWWAKLLEECQGKEIPRIPSDLKQFPVAEAIFRETLRLHPPVATDSRKTIETTTLAGRDLPPGVEITIPVIAISRHPDLYEACDEFRPQRWLDKREAIKAVEIIQFGGGPHFCVGYHVAWMETIQFLVAMANHVGKGGGRPVHEGAYPKITYMPLLHPDPKTRVTITSR